MNGRRSERGSASILALGIVGTMLVVVAAALLVAGAFVAHRRTAAAADAAALAAADTASGRSGGSPCSEAERVARANGARLEGCTLAGVVASVTASHAFLGMRTEAQARAGPPGTG